MQGNWVLQFLLLVLTIIRWMTYVFCIELNWIELNCAFLFRAKSAYMTSSRVIDIRK